MKTKKKRHSAFSHDAISVRWKLAWYMSLFVAIVLIVTWIFQVFLLGTFFRSIKKDEMRDTAMLLTQKVGSEDLEITALTEAVDHSLSIAIYEMRTEDSKKIVNFDATGSNISLSLTEERIKEFYRRAHDAGGSCSAKVALGGTVVEDGSLLDRLPFSSEDQSREVPPPKNLRFLHIALAKDAAENEYMIVLDASMQPLDTTVATLIKQYVWIAGIILFVAAVMVFLLYRKISTPLVRMNESAKRLALGKYDVTFSGEGYLETKELAATLNYASHELSRLDALQKELIANISHDLRTPLTMIQGYGEIMRDLPGENTPENIQVLIDETSRLTDLVNDLLDLSKIQSGARTPQAESVALTDAVNEVLERYDTLIKHRGYSVSFIANEKVTVMADRNMLLQVLYNLINNAINYTGRDRSVTVTQTLQNGFVRISITDTGEGIEPEEMPLIWERYYKVDKVHKRAMIGTGLGLSIVKEILELHRAAYGVNSTIGEGSTFWFELPIESIKNKTDKENHN